ncbi:NUDIX hydrolase [Bacillus mesophilum]|uniref:CoA pyrophosphatase n=1 Tax=Bacillus mesophilum TaxID=1071718 RepID=A0A7V7RJQ1_9BACI|nr:CoA pyrophosphatase [Bacillus mesophilum]KAB2331061.1 CoA pyrophosphatase [Bacillus mesophilum]
MEMNDILNHLRERTPVILGSDKFYKYSVLLPLVKKEDGLHILFEVRSLKMRRQPGEICFPGGRADSTDRDEAHTAMRETSEELGIKESSINNIFPLDYMISPFGTIIYPYAGFIDLTSTVLKPNQLEVEEVFTVPLQKLQELKPKVYKVNFRVEPEASFPFSSIAGGENYDWQTRAMDEYFYYWDDKVIWGLTARILHHFLEIIQERG